MGVLEDMSIVFFFICLFDFCGIVYAIAEAACEFLYPRK